VREVLHRFGPALTVRNLSLQADLRAPSPVALDPDALEQILNNLLSNAEKYGAKGGRIHVATRQAGERLWLWVRDHGPGVPLEQAEYVFQPFARLQDSLTEGVSGAGIGLTIARELARRHGGDLRLVVNPADLAEVPDSDGWLKNGDALPFFKPASGAAEFSTECPPFPREETSSGSAHHSGPDGVGGPQTAGACFLATLAPLPGQAEEKKR
jgi:signal transduction histidine kinase